MNRKLSKILVQQLDLSDCGVACLLSIIKYYGSDATIQQLHDLSGTDRVGTTLLGLMEAAKTLGFDAKGFEADSQSLAELNQPSILHVQKEKLEHYVVFFGFTHGIFTIGDPIEGIKEFTELELNDIWKTKRCLVLKPNNAFQTIKQQGKHKLDWFYKLVKEDINALVSITIIGLILSGLGIATAIFSQKLIDTILPSDNISMLITATIILFFMLFIRSVVLYIRGFMIIGQSMNFNGRIIDHFYASLLSLPKRFFDAREIGDMTTRLNDTTRIQNTITQIIGNQIIDIFTILVTIAVIFIYSWQIGLITLIFAPLYFIIVLAHKRRIIESQRDIMKNYAQTESFYIDTIKGIEEIKSTNSEAYFSSLGRIIYHTYQHKVFSLGSIGITLNLIYGTVGILFTSIILAVGGVFVIKNTLTIGTLMALFTLVSSFIPSVQNLAMLPIPLSAARIAFDRMFEFTAISPEALKGESITRIDELSISNVYFRFQGRSALLKGINMEVKKNEVVAIVGESGSGKSTIAQIIEKFYPIESGGVIINENIPLQTIDTECWRKLVGYVPQNPHIFNGTILENILLNSELSPNELFKQTREWGLFSFFEQFPMGFNTLVGEKGLNLSGGQIQVISILRTLIKEPQLLILDEATSAMDKNIEKKIILILREIKPQIATILITHSVQSLRDLVDKTYILEDGKIKYCGTHYDLMAFDNLYSQYFNH